MTESEKKIFSQIILMRKEYVFRHLIENNEYREVYNRQLKTGADVDTILEKLSKSDRLIIRRHYEGETNKEDYHLSGMYLQGLHDCMNILTFLRFNTEVNL